MVNDFMAQLMPGIVLYIIWLAFLFGPAEFNFGFLVISILNMIIFLTKSKKRQLFYSNTPSTGRAIIRNKEITIQQVLSWKNRLRLLPNDSTQNEKIRFKELSQWDINSTMQSIFIFLSPVSVVFSFLSSSFILTFFFSIVFSLFMLFLMQKINRAIENQKILSHEIYKEHNIALQNQLKQYAPIYIQNNPSKMRMYINNSKF